MNQFNDPNWTGRVQRTMSSPGYFYDAHQRRERFMHGVRCVAAALSVLATVSTVIGILRVL